MSSVIRGADWTLGPVLCPGPFTEVTTTVLPLPPPLPTVPLQQLQLPAQAGVAAHLHRLHRVGLHHAAEHSH